MELGWQQIIEYLTAGSLGAILVKVIESFLNRSERQARIERDQATAAKTIVEASKGLLADIGQRMNEIEQENKVIRRENADIRCENRELKKKQRGYETKLDEYKTELGSVRAELKDQVAQGQVAKDRMRLLAKVIVVMLNATGNGDRPECIDDFIYLINGNVSAKERRFLIDIINEVDDPD